MTLILDWVNTEIGEKMRAEGLSVLIIFLLYTLVCQVNVQEYCLSRSDLINFKNERQHLCNFFGTVYKNSSREVLVNSLPANKSTKCFIQTRDTWVPTETYASMEKYLRTVSDSDLTLNPVGKNTECYRIYEAVALGSVPVVEDVLTPGQCVAPLRLLKQHQAPFIFIKNWTELPLLLEVERKLSLNSRIARRKRLVKWYEDFKKKIRVLFLSTIRKFFFQKSEVKTVVTAA